MRDILETKSDLIEWMQRGVKPFEDWRIGTEHEKYGFCRESLKPLPYEGSRGICAMLEGLIIQFGWQGQYEKEKLIALCRPEQQGGGCITLEPGGQLELSGALLENIHQTFDETSRHLNEVRIVADDLKQGYLGIGLIPFWHYSTISTVPKERYILMNKYLPKQGNRGLDMMYLSCTIQVNLDFSTEKDMVEKARVALALQPIVSALFANSPFRDNRISGALSERSVMWSDIDDDRTGMLPFVFEEGFGFEQYVDYVLDVPMFYIHRDGQYIDALGQSFRDFLVGKLPALRGQKPTIEDWEHHLTTLLPQIRLKRYIEMRGADGGSEPFVSALSALWVGLLYTPKIQKKMMDFVQDWSEEERKILYETIPYQGLSTPFRGQTIYDIACFILDASKMGLTSRAVVNSAGEDETKYLNPLYEIIESGKTQADILLHKFHHEWKGDMSRLFDERML